MAYYAEDEEKERQRTSDLRTELITLQREALAKIKWIIKTWDERTKQINDRIMENSNIAFKAHMEKKKEGAIDSNTE